MFAALAAGTGAALVGAGPASAADGDATDVAVDVVAARTILSTSGWTAVETWVSNDGPAPAAGVSVAITLPAGLQPFTLESSSDWTCDWAQPVAHCTHVGDLAPGQRVRAYLESASVSGVAAGTVLEPSAAVTTSTPQTDTTNDTDSVPISIVESGTIQGHLWNDLNADGLRQATEPAATSAGLSFLSQDDSDQYGFSNNFDGTYSESVPAKRFQAKATLARSAWRFTTPGADSDLHQTTQDTFAAYGESPVFTVDPSTPAVIDLGVVAAFRPTGFSPATAAPGTTATVTVNGAYFTQDKQVTLTRSGQTPIPGTITTIATDKTTMTVTFPLTGAAPGAWTLTVSSVFGDRSEAAAPFTVTAP